MNNFSNITFATDNSGPNIPLMIGLIIFGVLFVLGAIIITVYFVKSHKKKKQINNESWFIALGGKDNFSDVKGVGSRLSLVIKDKEKLDRQKLKELGVSSILTMSDKIVLVINNQAEDIANLLIKD